MLRQCFFLTLIIYFSCFCFEKLQASFPASIPNDNDYLSAHLKQSGGANFSFDERNLNARDLSYIVRITEEIIKLTTPNDVIIALGQKTAHFASALKYIGEIDPCAQRKVFAPAYDQGELISKPLIRLMKLKCDATVVKSFKALSVLNNTDLVTCTNPAKLSCEEMHRIADELQDKPYLAFDFKTKKYITSYDWNLSKAHIIQYIDYLKHTIMLDLSAISALKGHIYIIDTVSSGEHIRNFIDIIILMSQLENNCYFVKASNNIGSRINVINVNYASMEDRHEYLAEYAVTNLLVDRDILTRLVKKSIPNQTFFCPPWCWVNNFFNHIPSWELLQSKATLKMFIKKLYAGQSISDIPPSVKVQNIN